MLLTRKVDDEGIPTKTTEMELENEKNISLSYIESSILVSKRHYKYLLQFANQTTIDGNKRESLCVWNPCYVLVPLVLLKYDNYEELESLKSKCTTYLARRITKYGLFSGFPTDYPSLISNYGVLNSTIVIGTPEIYNLYNRKVIYNYLLSLKAHNGAFRSAIGAEIDVRSTYSAVYIAYMLNILTPEFTNGVIDFVISCQNYDGGFSPQPNCESHGGFSHCAIGVLFILNALHRININAHIRWLTSRQMEYSGGFQGRTNKLSDSCYTWWEGSAMRIISDYMNILPFWDIESVTDFVLRVAQSVFGGFSDHPPNSCDYFHTLYSLEGICVCGERNKYNFDDVDPLSGVPKTLTKQFKSYFEQQPFIN